MGFPLDRKFEEGVMADAADHTVPLTLGRRIMSDFLHASMRVPCVAIEKPMELARVVAARQATRPRPSWCGIFTKAYGKVVAATPELRRAFLTFPYERMYQYGTTTADIAVECEIDGEKIVAHAPVRNPGTKPLLDIDHYLHECKTAPLKKLRSFRRLLSLSRFPRWLRRWCWWAHLNVSGRLRGKHTGAFGVSSVGGQGVDSLRPISPCPSLLHYGALDARGRSMVRLTFDHRIIDGRLPADALVRLEHILQTEIVAELEALAVEQSRALPLAG